MTNEQRNEYFIGYLPITWFALYFLLNLSVNTVVIIQLRK